MAAASAAVVTTDCGSLQPMSDVAAVDTESLESWFDANVVLLLIIAAGLIALYVASSRIVDSLVSRVLASQVSQVAPGSVEAAEIQKRAATLSSLITALLRILIFAIIFTLIVGFFGLWSVLAGLGLLLAALTLAGQSIVLDYLMGVLIITEGQYYKGDVIEVNGVSGAVEEVGLRRTTIRSADGTVFSISNGEIRVVANRTRVFAAAEVIVPGIREQDLERVVAIMDAVGQELADDPAYSASIIEPARVQVLGDPDDLGMSATMRGKVIAGERWNIATETRRRLNRAFVAEGIELNKRGIVSRRQRAAAGPPEADEDDGDGSV
jgi:small conductance mechanosensitive channel